MGIPIIRPSDTDYESALARERDVFENCLNVHELPEIFHYWSRRHLQPKLLPFGFDSPTAMFGKFLEERCREGRSRPKRFVSLGSGNCDLEIELALQLRACGHESFIIDCVDLNPAMLDRARVAAEQAGVQNYLEFVQSDLNSWTPAYSCDAAIANQSLHHVLNLEGLFEQVKRSLTDNGCFIISDMIGRNGHQRWPEALEIVDEFWRRIPPSYRFNCRSGRYEELHQNWDCSVEGFEGIRSQDILPLLLRYFHFRLFLPFGNVIDPFVDRSFGPHFDATAQWDRDFIDEVHQRDEAALSSGLLTPTHMMAVAGNDPRVDLAFPGNLSPEFCVREPDDMRRSSSPRKSRSSSSYDWSSLPHDPVRELEIVCRRLSQSEIVSAERMAWALRLEKYLQERTAWAIGLEKELQEQTAWALRLEKELGERTAWALDLSKELETSDEKAAWALKLKDELEERTRQVLALEEELHGYIDNPVRFAIRLAAGACRRIKRMAINMWRWW